VAQAVISDITTPDQRTQAFGIFSGMFRLGFVLGPPLAYLAQSVPPLPGVTPLGMSFVVSAIIALLAAGMCFFFVPESRPPAECTQFRLSVSDFGFDKLANSFRNPTLGRVFVMTFLTGGTFTIFTFAFQPFFLTVLGQDAKNLAITFVVFGVIAFVSQVFLLEPLRQRTSLVNLLVGALFLRGLLFILIPSFPTITAFWTILIFFGMVNAFPMPLLDSIISLRAKDDEQGEALGTNASYLSISNAVGPAISGLLVSFGYSLPFFVAGALTVAIALFALTLKQPNQPAPAGS
ncbi:MAG: MFS transporter, partial [Cyanobacteria bacterium J06627_15]